MTTNAIDQSGNRRHVLVFDRGESVMAGLRDFARRHGIVEMELRRGRPARMILETARERDVDMVLLAWSRVLDDVHGAVVYEVLAGAEVPVMLIPADVPAPAGAPG